MGLVLEKLNVSVEEITLGDVDVFETELVNELEDTSGDGCFADSRAGSIGTDGGFVFEDDTVEFGDVELVSGGTGRDGEGEAVFGEDGTG